MYYEVVFSISYEVEAGSPEEAEEKATELLLKDIEETGATEIFEPKIFY